jgi:hypothetical protein
MSKAKIIIIIVVVVIIYCAPNCSKMDGTLALCLDALLLVPPTFPVVLLEPAARSRFRLFTTSVFNDSGLGIPCNLVKSPQALQTGRPSWVLRQREVLFVEQFEQDIECPFSLSVLEIWDDLRVGGGFTSLVGKIGTDTELKPFVESFSSDNDIGVEGELGSKMSLFWEISAKFV